MPPSETTHNVYDTSGAVLMRISKRQDGYQVELPNKLVVYARDVIQLVPSPPLRGTLRGLCGDFDGEPTYDKAGPKDCLYTDMELFKYAWSVPEGDGCDKTILASMQDKVTQFQKHCEHVPRGGTTELKSFYGKKKSFVLY